MPAPLGASRWRRSTVTVAATARTASRRTSSASCRCCPRRPCRRPRRACAANRHRPELSVYVRTGELDGFPVDCCWFVITARVRTHPAVEKVVKVVDAPAPTTAGSGDRTSCVPVSHTAVARRDPPDGGVGAGSAGRSPRERHPVGRVVVLDGAVERPARRRRWCPARAGGRRRWRCSRPPPRSRWAGRSRPAGPHEGGARRRSRGRRRRASRPRARARRRGRRGCCRCPGSSASQNRCMIRSPPRRRWCRSAR